MSGHFRFCETLKFKASQVDGCQVVIQDESYTLKTCGRCDGLNMKLGGKESFSFEKGHYETDRDVNGARNIP